MFNLAFEIVAMEDVSKFTLKDTSTGDDTIVSKTITVTKSDTSFKDYIVPIDVTEFIVDGFDRDYALNVKYTVVTNLQTEGVSKEVEFVLLGYSRKARLDRVKALRIDESIIDKTEYKKQTLEIRYLMMTADDLIWSASLVDAQKALDRIQDIILDNPIKTCCD